MVRSENVQNKNGRKSFGLGHSREHLLKFLYYQTGNIHFLFYCSKAPEIYDLPLRINFAFITDPSRDIFWRELSEIH